MSKKESFGLVRVKFVSSRLKVAHSIVDWLKSFFFSYNHLQQKGLTLNAQPWIVVFPISDCFDVLHKSKPKSELFLSMLRIAPRRPTRPEIMNTSMFANGVSAICGGFPWNLFNVYMNFIEINCQLAYQKDCFNESFSSRFYFRLRSHSEAFSHTQNGQNLAIIFISACCCIWFQFNCRRFEEE